MKVKISAIERDHTDAGPGLRTEVFFYGCSKDCPGCQNKWTEDMPYIEVSTFKLARKVASLRNSNVSISGGEPFEQPVSLLSFLKWLRFWNRIRYFKKTHVLLYTGMTWEELGFMNFLSDKLVDKVQSQVNLIVVNPWEHLKSYKIVKDTCVGSWNQRAYEVVHRKPPILHEITVDGFGHLILDE